MSDPFSTPKSKRIGAKPAQSPVLTHYIYQHGFSENKIEANYGYHSFQLYKIREDCSDPYAEYLEFCRINEYRLLKAEKIGNNIYVQLGTQTNVHSKACMFVMDMTNTHNAAHPLHRIHCATGGRMHIDGNEYEPDIQIAPIGFPFGLGPTVVGEIQYSTQFITPPLDAEPTVIGCDRKAGLYLRHTPHISAFICVDLQYPWPTHGYPKIVLYYYDRPDINPASLLVQPRRIVNIGRPLTPQNVTSLLAMYPSLNATNMFGNGFGGCGDCHPAADPAHYVFEIPGPTVLYVDPGHTLAAGNVPIEDVDVGIEVDCRVLLNRILTGALQENLPIGPQWAWDPMAVV